MDAADRAEFEARRMAERRPAQPLLPGVRWPGFAPRSLEVLYGIALEQHEHWEGAWMAADLFETGETRAAYGQAWRWARVVTALRRVLAARLPHQPPRTK